MNTNINKNNILPFPKMYNTPEEALEAAKGWDFETVVIIGHTKEGGSDEGGLILSSNKEAAKEQAKDMLLMAEMLHWMAMKKLGFL